MRPAFRLGQIVACPYALEAVPHSAIVRAIVTRATTQHAYDEQPIRTDHAHGGTRFRLESDAARTMTKIRPTGEPAIGKPRTG